MKKSILALGCSHSSGAELSLAAAADYWNEQLAMENPYEDYWKHSDENLIKKQTYHKWRVENLQEDWNYNTKKAWPCRLHHALEDYDVVSAANPGTGISFIRHLYNMPHLRYFGADPDLMRVTEALVVFTNKDKPIKKSNLEWVKNPYMDMSRYEPQSVYTKFYTQKFRPALVLSKEWEDGKFINYPNFAQLRHFNRGQMAYEAAFSRLDRAADEKDITTNFKHMMENVDVLVWQLTDEPRMCVSHPNLAWFCWFPTPQQGVGELKRNIMEHVTEVLALHPKFTAFEVARSIAAWEDECDKMVDYYMNSYDQSQLVSDNLIFVNYILAKRKQKGLKTIMFNLDNDSTKIYDMEHRINKEDCIYFSAEGLLQFPHDVDEMKERMRNNTFPFCIGGHISEWANKQLTQIIKEQIMEDEREQLPSAVDDAADVISGLTPEEKARIKKEKEQELKERIEELKKKDPFIYD